MKIYSEKTTTMLFNFTNNYQFGTRLQLNGEVIDIVEETKLLGTVLTCDLRWDRNTDNIVKKKHNAKMEI